MSDPNGWVLNPPTKIVKIHSLSNQPSLNGQTAVVVGYLQDSRRYVVVLTSSPQQRQVSLRADSLSSCGWLDSARAQYEMVARNPQVRRQLASAWNDAVRPALPAPIRDAPPKVLAAGIGAVLALSIYLLGFSRTVLWISFAVLAGALAGPAVAAGRPPREAAASVVPRAQDLLRTSGLPLASRVAGSYYGTAALLLAAAAVFVNGMVLPRSPDRAPLAAPVLQPAGSASALSQEERERYYRLGFDDAAAERPFGHSLARIEPKSAAQRVLDETTLDLSAEAPGGDPPPYYGSPPPRSQNSSSRFRPRAKLGVGNVLTIGFTLNTLYQLGLAGGPGVPWSFAAFRQNLSQLPPWRMGLLGLSIYRVASIFL